VARRHLWSPDAARRPAGALPGFEAAHVGRCFDKDRQWDKGCDMGHSSRPKKKKKYRLPQFNRRGGGGKPTRGSHVSGGKVSRLRVAPSVKERMLPHGVIILLCGAPFSPDNRAPRWDEVYRRKRKFDVTPEPRGQTARGKEAVRHQKHAARRTLRFQARARRRDESGP
jgi:hypothetical protein